MSGVLAQVEDAIIEVARDALLGRVRTVDQLPGGWSNDTLRRILQNAPAVYVLWLGGNVADADDDEATLSGRWAVYAVVNQPRIDARRRGSAQEIGAYEILEIIIPRLHGNTIDGIGSLRFERTEHLVDEAVFDAGATVYSATFTLPRMDWPTLTPEQLGDFITYHQDYDLDPDSEDEPLQEDTLTLPQ